MIDPTVLLWILILFAFIGLCHLLGRIAIDAIVRPAPPLVIAGAALLGAALLALQLWLYGSVRIPWNVVTLLLPWLGIALWRRDRVLALVREDRQGATHVRQVVSSLTALELILVVLGILIMLTYLLSLLTKPLWAWDAIAVWLFKAKLFYGQQAVDLQAISQDVTRNLEYPPLLPLMTASLYTLIGQANDLLGKAVTFIFVPVAAAGCLTALSRWFNRQLAITFTFVLVALPLFAPVLIGGAYMGYADYPLGVCMMLSLIHFYEGETSRQPMSYAFAVVFAAMAALIKNEGLVFLAIVLALLVVHLVITGRLTRPARRDWPILAPLLLAIGPVVAWRVYVHSAGLTYGTLGQIDVAQDLPLLPDRAAVILQYLGSLWSFHTDYPWLFVSFLLSGVLLAANRFRAGTLQYAAVGLQAVSYFVFYLFTPLDLNWHLATSVDRLVIQLAPSIVLILAIALRPHLAIPHQAISRRITHQYPLSSAAPNRTIG